jgi:hypothetical protein
MALCVQAAPNDRVDPTFISKAAFDTIPLIYDQSDLETQHLANIGKIFDKHGVLTMHGLHLLHRHYLLLENHIAFTAHHREGARITKLTELDAVDSGALCGQLYLLNIKGKFQAYEYEYGEAVQFSQSFLQDLADYILEHNLRNKVALASTPPTETTTEVEVGTTATVTVPNGKRKPGDKIRVVGWHFETSNLKRDLESEIIVAQGTSGYKTTVTGPHKVLYSVGSCSSLKLDGPFPFEEVDVLDVLRENDVV